MSDKKEQFGHYPFEVYEHKDESNSEKLYVYRLYCDRIIESDNFYDSEQEARFAAIGHITLLEDKSP